MMRKNYLSLSSRSNLIDIFLRPNDPIAMISKWELFIWIID